MNKKGVSLAVVLVAISVMTLLISVASVVGSGAITSANFDEYISSLNKMSGNINQYYLENGVLPITSEVVSAESLGNEFIMNLTKNSDLENKLYVVDIQKLKDSTIKKGSGTVSNKDVFVVAENTQNVYYLKGFNYKSQTYFGI